VRRCLYRQPVQPHDLFPSQLIGETPAHCKISTQGNRNQKRFVPPCHRQAGSSWAGKDENKQSHDVPLSGIVRDLRTGDSDITIGPRYSRICSFGIETPLKGGARRVICDDWHNLRSAGEQQRWAYLFNTGLISKEEADA
jgi:hypothetical protein